MQTFLPYANFVKSPECLDYKRLGKQRLEAYDIYRINMYILHRKNLFDSKKQKDYLLKRYKNHLIVLMWRGYELALLIYGHYVCREWIRRGYNDNMSPKFRKALGKHFLNRNDIEYPLWLGDERVHSSHRSNLLRKKPEHYRKFGWKEPDNLPYYWVRR
ncbi:MAG: MSMEG_6728 family protein [Candidatus Hodarchaeota archaeon]